MADQAKEIQNSHKEYVKAAETKVVDDGLAQEAPVLKPPGQNDNGGNDAVLTAK